MRRLAALILFLFIFLPPPSASAGTAPDITSQCLVTNARGLPVSEATDRKPRTSLQKQKKADKAFFTVSLPQPVYHIYVELVKDPLPLVIQVEGEGGWRTVAQAEYPFAHQYFAVPGLTRFRIAARDPIKEGPSLGELYLFGEGEVPPQVQRWQMPSGKMDMMLIVAHPDDELLWFGGTIPTYAGQRGMKLLNVYMVPGTDLRRTELLNGLWHCGQTLYPLFGPFRDLRAGTAEAVYGVWGKKRVQQTITAWLRRWQPDVVLTHAVGGEYGHGAHRATSRGVQEAIKASADAAMYPQSPVDAGPWQVKKLYLHLGGAQGRLEMDWHQPLAAFGGETSYQVAAEAFAMHLSQQSFKMPTDDSRLTNARFQLVFSRVGTDTSAKDFLEHVGGK